MPSSIWDNDEAVLQVGANYSRGQGAPKDEAQVLQGYQRAAEQATLELRKPTQGAASALPIPLL